MLREPQEDRRCIAIGFQRVRLGVPDGLGTAASFGVAELRRALASSRYQVATGGVDLEIVLAMGDDGGPDLTSVLPRRGAESYAIARRSPTRLTLVGSDDVGLMYACLDLAEQLEMGTALDGVADREACPELRIRGLYTFRHNAEAERGWVADPEYWQCYADALARWRYNRFNLIFGHQTAYLIPIYAFMLGELDEAFPEIQVAGITPEERRRHLQALQTASAAMASRGITFMLGIWQSRPWQVDFYRFPEFSQPTRVSGTEDLVRLVDYTRRGFALLMARCPYVGGIQLRMNAESGVTDQRFFVEAFGPVVRELVQQGRRLIVELRNWYLHPRTVAAFRDTGADVIVSTKYFAEHQGLPYQPPVMRRGYSYDSLLRRDRAESLLWQLWSLGSHRLFVWGDPEYARRFARSCHLGGGAGFSVTPPGSQKGFSFSGQIVPGDWRPRQDLPEQWGFRRYWFFHMAFGRAGYDSQIGDDVFLHQLARRVGAEAAPLLLDAYRSASRIVSYLVTHHMDDPNMFVWPELDCGGTIDHYARTPAGETTLFATAHEYAQARVAGQAGAKLSPFRAAEDLDRFADETEAVLAGLAEAPVPTDSLEIQAVRVDFAALASLARYSAGKARAAGNLCLFYASGERRFLDLAESDAEDGVRLWDALCARTADYYPRLHLGPTGGHWRDNRGRVAYDLRRVRRVRELFDAYGGFTRGFHFGQPISRPSVGPQIIYQGTGLEPEPRFTGVDAKTRYAAERGHGWLETDGLRSGGLSRLPLDLLRGVHRIRPDDEVAPEAQIRSMPLDSLTHYYASADEPHTFRVDLPDGEYEITLLAPAVGGAVTPVQAQDAGAVLGGSAQGVVRLDVVVKGQPLDVTIGGQGTWALSALIVRPAGPRIAHLPPIAVRAEEDVLLKATATATAGACTMRLRYCTGPRWRELPMDGDGVAFEAAVPLADVEGEVLKYELLAEDVQGRASCLSGLTVPVVRGFRPPFVVQVHGPDTWSPSGELVIRATLKNGACARQVRLHYREADQNREFRLAQVDGGRSGVYEFRLDARSLDVAYELIYYVEVVDVLGDGSFYPDPFKEARYVVCAPAAAHTRPLATRFE